MRIYRRNRINGMFAHYPVKSTPKLRSLIIAFSCLLNLFYVSVENPVTKAINVPHSSVPNKLRKKDNNKMNKYCQKFLEVSVVIL